MPIKTRFVTTEQTPRLIEMGPFEPCVQMDVARRKLVVHHAPEVSGLYAELGLPSSRVVLSPDWNTVLDSVTGATLATLINKQDWLEYCEELRLELLAEYATYTPQGE